MSSARGIKYITPDGTLAMLSVNNKTWEKLKGFIIQDKVRPFVTHSLS